MEQEHIIFVRDYGQTYIARSNGQTASCTQGREQAAKALARKIMGNRPHEVTMIFKNNDRQFLVKPGR